MKKVLIFGVTPSQGGIETFALNISKVMKGVADIYLYNFSDFPLAYNDVFTNEYDAKILNIVTKNNRLGHFKRKLQYKEFFKKNHFDIVHVNANSPSNYDFASAALISGAKVIYHSHNDNAESFVFKRSDSKISYYIRKWQKRKLSKLNVIKVAVSKNAAKWMFEKYDDVKIIPNGVDFDKNKFSVKKRIDGRKELNIKSDDIVLIAASRLTKQKNFSKVLSIAKNAIERGIAQKLIIVGDGEEKHNILETVSQFTPYVQKKIHVIGAQKDMQKWYSSADFMIMPSLYEGLPYTILEAQANGLNCVVSTAIPDQAVINKHLIDFGDVNSNDDIWANKFRVDVNNTEYREKSFYIAEKSNYSLNNFSKYMNSLYKI